ncbi:tRNA uridine-5-carboxymethylaminomethyl(34) synthesis enzyme MnmG, partial [Psychromonas arctica]
RRPEVNYESLMKIEGLVPAIADTIAAEQVEINIKYQGYNDRQLDEIEKVKRHEDTAIPVELDYSEIKALSNEV